MATAGINGFIGHLSFKVYPDKYFYNNQCLLLLSCCCYVTYVDVQFVMTGEIGQIVTMTLLLTSCCGQVVARRSCIHATLLSLPWKPAMDISASLLDTRTR